MVVVPGREPGERIDHYLRWRTCEVRDEQGRTATERAREKYGQAKPLPKERLPRALAQAETARTSCFDRRPLPSVIPASEFDA